uniref:Uncharacterized protein n=1 Tax=Arundo donax TaxID=35708 RepID=A0A0A8Z2D6_ARUDO
MTTEKAHSLTTTSKAVLLGVLTTLMELFGVCL